MDTKMEVTLVVEDASKAEEVEEEDEISEPEDGTCSRAWQHNIRSLANDITDSIAGQMQSLKTGGAPPKKRRQQVDDSSDGSDTEGDVESESETDTDTDSDEE
jgi:translocation protein SEC63